MVYAIPLSLTTAFNLHPKKFKEFAALWGFEHVTSSPLYGQSNGEVVWAVQTMKAKLNKCDDEYLALLKKGRCNISAAW